MLTAHEIVKRLAEARKLSDIYTLQREAQALQKLLQLGQLTPDAQASLIKTASDAYFGRTYDGTWEHGRYGTNFVAAIKAVRIATGFGLKEAKDWCDKHRSEFK